MKFLLAAREVPGAWIDVAMNLTTRDTISYVELVKDGHVVQSLRYEELAQTGHFPRQQFDESGWFLVRAVADVEHTYRFASSAPWYVEIGDEPPRISKQSAKFFLDWSIERAARIQLADPNQRRQVLMFHEHAREFWQDRVSQANAP